jgi:hypothetical protein
VNQNRAIALEHHVTSEAEREGEPLVGRRLGRIGTRLREEIRQRHPLERHVCLTALVEDADGLVVDHRHARVTRAAAGVEQHASILGPGHPVVGGRLDHHPHATGGTVGVGEEHPPAPRLSEFAVDLDEARHARAGFDERAP